MIHGLFWQAASALLAGAPSVLAKGAPGDTLPPGSGDTLPPRSITLFDPLKGKTLTDLLASILAGLTALAIPVVVIMIIIGAYHIITSGGNPGRRSKGKDYILWSVIGFAILLLADSVVALLQEFLKP